MEKKVAEIEPSVNITLSRKDEGRKRLEKIKNEETRTVRGIFRCYETPQAAVRICIKKYKDVPMFDKTMVDGLEYEVPLYVARHLNGIDKCAAEAPSGLIHSCSYPIHAYTIDSRGVSRVDVGQYRSRFGFNSLDYS